MVHIRPFFTNAKRYGQPASTPTKKLHLGSRIQTSSFSILCYPQVQYEAMSFPVLLLFQGNKRVDFSDTYKITMEESAFCIVGLNS